MPIGVFYNAHDEGARRAMLLFALLFSLLLCACRASFSTSTITVLKEDQDFHAFKEVCPITGQVVEGYTWSRCRDQTQTAIGCASATGTKLNFGEVFRTSHAEYRCERNKDRAMFRPVACIVDGVVIGIDELKKVGKFYFTCAKRGEEGIGLTIAGCSDAAGEIVSLGGTFRRGHFMYQCQKDDSKVYEVGVGCVTDEYGLMGIGEMFRVDSYYYECRRRGEHGLKLEAVGCVDSEGDMVSAGDSFGLGSILYECEEYKTQKGKTSVRQKPIGCLAVKEGTARELVRYTFGDRWYKPIKKNLGYTLECTLKGQMVVPSIVECVASTEHDRKVIKVGCGMKYDDTHVFICKHHEGESVLATVRSVTKGRTHKDVIRSFNVTVC